MKKTRVRRVKVLLTWLLPSVPASRLSGTKSSGKGGLAQSFGMPTFGRISISITLRSGRRCFCFSELALEIRQTNAVVTLHVLAWYRRLFVGFSEHAHDDIHRPQDVCKIQRAYHLRRPRRAVHVDDLWTKHASKAKAAGNCECTSPGHRLSRTHCRERREARRSCGIRNAGLWNWAQCMHRTR
jgi:hypothetical protein